MSQLFYQVLLTSFYATIVGGILLFVKKILKGKINSQWQYLLWMILIFKLIIPQGIENQMSLFQDKWFSQIENFIMEKVSNKDFQNINDNQKLQEENLDNSSPIIKNRINEKGEVNTESNSTQEENQDEKEIALNSYNKFFEVAVIIWIIGISIKLLCISYMFYIFQKNVKEQQWTDKKWEGLLEESKNKIHVKSCIPVYYTNQIHTPVLMGGVKAKILLPIQIKEFSSNELNYIFIHELVHFKRKDLWINYLLITLQAIHWFNPFIAYFFNQIRQDMELATDEKVLQSISAEERKQYGYALLHVLENSIKYPYILPVITMASDKKILIRRLNMIKRFHDKKGVRPIVSIGLFITLAIVLCTYNTQYNKSFNREKPREEVNEVNKIIKIPINQFKYKGLIEKEQLVYDTSLILAEQRGVESQAIGGSSSMPHGVLVNFSEITIGDLLNKEPEDNKSFCIVAPKIHGYEEREGSLRVFVTTHWKKYRISDHIVYNQGGGKISFMAYYVKQGGKWAIKQCCIAGDGSYYVKSIKEMTRQTFSGKELRQGLSDEMIDSQLYIKEQINLERKNLIEYLNANELEDMYYSEEFSNNTGFIKLN